MLSFDIMDAQERAMRFEGLDLNLLVAFDALMEARSVTAASRRVNLSQSAMSAAIGRLRTFFDDDLFVMAGRRLVPTPLALSLEASTRDVPFQLGRASGRERVCQYV